MQPGDSIVVYGAGPVGLMAAYSAMIQGASKVMIVDRHPDRLRLTEQIGALPIDDSTGDPVEQVLDQTDGHGADKGCECVGYQAHDPQGHEDAAMTMNRLVDSVRFTGHIGVVGIFLPQDQHGPDELERNGKIVFDMGKFWFKGQKIGTGQADVKHYNRQLRDLIHQGPCAVGILAIDRRPRDRSRRVPRPIQSSEAARRDRDHPIRRIRTVLLPFTEPRRYNRAGRREPLLNSWRNNRWP